MSEHSAFLPRYQQLRQVAMRLHQRLAETLSKSVLDEGGKKLGILQKNVLVLDSADEIAVLMDYCIHDVRRQGKNAVERYLAESPPPAGSDERLLLEAMLQASYSLFAVEATEPGIGVRGRDLLRDEPVFLMDVAFSHSADVGLVLATRIFAPEGVARTTGAALPVGVLPAAGRERFLQSLKASFQEEEFGSLSPERRSDFVASVIRTCLKKGAAAHIAYAEPGAAPTPRRAPTAPPAARRVGRNDPCPCGSGRKFKHCCGAPR